MNATALEQRRSLQTCPTFSPSVSNLHYVHNLRIKEIPSGIVILILQFTLAVEQTGNQSHALKTKYLGFRKSNNSKEEAIEYKNYFLVQDRSSLS